MDEGDSIGVDYWSDISIKLFIGRRFKVNRVRAVDSDRRQRAKWPGPNASASLSGADRSTNVKFILIRRWKN